MGLLVGLPVGVFGGLVLWLAVFHWTLALRKLLSAPGTPSSLLGSVQVPLAVLSYLVLWSLVVAAYGALSLVLLFRQPFWVGFFLGSCVPLVLLALRLLAIFSGRS